MEIPRRMVQPDAEQVLAECRLSPDWPHQSEKKRLSLTNIADNIHLRSF
jgi:hypothetical protein